MQGERLGNLLDGYDSPKFVEKALLNFEGADRTQSKLQQLKHINKLFAVY